MAAGMNWGILSLLAVIGTVLGGVAAFFIYLARRAAKGSLLALTGAALPRRGGVLEFGRSGARQHLGGGIFRPIGRVGRRCARGRGRSDTVIFSDGMRQIVPGSGRPTL
jgi:hypothetical protein